MNLIFNFDFNKPEPEGESSKWKGAENGNHYMKKRKVFIF